MKKQTYSGFSLYIINSIFAYGLFLFFIFNYFPTQNLLSNKFLLHPLIMLFVFIFVMPIAILTYRINNEIDVLNHDVSKMIHASLNLIVILLAILGIMMIYSSHIGKKHFTSFHSWLGIMVISVYIIQWILSFYIFYYGSKSLKKKFMPIHKFTGMMLIIAILITILLGLTIFSMKFMANKNNIQKDLPNLYLNLIMFFVFYSFIGIFLILNQKQIQN